MSRIREKVLGKLCSTTDWYLELVVLGLVAGLRFEL